MNSWQMYKRYIAVSIAAQMQYRASFIMQLLGHFLITIVEFLAIWALFQRFDTIQGWTFYEIAVFHGMVSIAFSINDALTRGFDWVDKLIRNGDFDRFLLRPRGTILQLLGYEFTLKRFGRFSQGVAVLLIGTTHLHVTWTVGKIFILVWALFGGVCLFMGLIIIQATITFWTIETLEIMNTLTYGGIDTAQYPMPIYLPWFRKFFTFVVPLACVNYFPLLLVLEKSDPLGSSPLFQAVAPISGVLFLGVSLLGWQVGLRYYSSTGS